jgi:hypothetical protein
MGRAKSSHRFFLIQVHRAAWILRQLFQGGDTGGTTFSGTIIPEPSTYALILAGSALMLVLVRRRFRHQDR